MDYEKRHFCLFYCLDECCTVYETSGLYYKTFRVIIYDRKLCSSLEHKLRSYNRNPSYGQLRLAKASYGQVKLAKASYGYLGLATTSYSQVRLAKAK